MVSILIHAPNVNKLNVIPFILFRSYSFVDMHLFLTRSRASHILCCGLIKKKNKFSPGSAAQCLTANAMVVRPIPTQGEWIIFISSLLQEDKILSLVSFLVHF